MQLVPDPLDGNVGSFGEDGIQMGGQQQCRPTLGAADLGINVGCIVDLNVV